MYTITHVYKHVYIYIYISYLISLYINTRINIWINVSTIESILQPPLGPQSLRRPVICSDLWSPLGSQPVANCWWLIYGSSTFVDVCCKPYHYPAASISVELILYSHRAVDALSTPSRFLLLRTGNKEYLQDLHEPQLESHQNLHPFSRKKSS